MNSRPFLIPAILATTAAFGFSGNVLSASPDAQAQAAALLSSQTSASPNTHAPAPAYTSALAGVDAHTRAAALLSGVHIGHESTTSVSVIPSAVALDAHARAAALLSGSRTTVGGNPPIIATRETLGQHPGMRDLIRQDARQTDGALSRATRRRR